MQSQDKLRIALLSAYAIAIHGFERLIPAPVPWLRFGLANIITLTTLVLYGLKPAMMITLIRVTVGSFFAGTFLGPAFLLSLGAGIVSTIAMGVIVKYMPSLFSPVGISLIGALLHNMTQLFLAYLVFIKRFEVVIILAPVILITGTITGTLNGIVSAMLITGLNKPRQ
jgi:heptaprenyl diphosphate synthase